MIVEILCFFGLHNLVADSFTDGSFRSWSRCVDCNKVIPNED